MWTLGCQQILQIPLSTLCLFNYAFLPLLSTCSSSNSILTFPTPQILYYYSCYSTNMPAEQAACNSQISTSVSDSRATETRAFLLPNTALELTGTASCGSDSRGTRTVCCPKENDPSGKVKPPSSFPSRVSFPGPPLRVSVSHTYGAEETHLTGAHVLWLWGISRTNSGSQGSHK